MNAHSRKTLLALTVATLTTSLATSHASADDFTCNWFSIDSGGKATSGPNGFELAGTFGQTDAGATHTAMAPGGLIELTGGFWVGSSTPPCPADFNHDASVDFFDYLDFVAAFSSAAPEADFNHDDSIDFFDYLDFVAAFSVGC